MHKHRLAISQSKMTHHELCAAVDSWQQLYQDIAWYIFSGNSVTWCTLQVNGQAAS